jgi:hypothetical protein
VTKPPDWHGLLATDLLLSSLAAGLYLAAAAAELTSPAIFARVAHAAYPLTLGFLLGDLVCLVFDLGDPLRFHHMLRVFKPTSPMSLGTWCLTILAFFLTAVVGFGLLPTDGPGVDWARKTALVLGLFPALGVAIYKGVLLSTSAQPGWSDARWLGAYLSSSSLVLGCAVLMGVALLLGAERASTLLRVALLLLLVLNAIPAGLLIANLRPAFSRCYTPRRQAGLVALCAGGGTVLPLGLLLLGSGAATGLAAILSLLAAGLVVRLVILRLPHVAARRSAHTEDYSQARRAAPETMRVPPT